MGVFSGQVSNQTEHIVSMGKGLGSIHSTMEKLPFLKMGHLLASPEAHPDRDGRAQAGSGSIPPGYMTSAITGCIRG